MTLPPADELRSSAEEIASFKHLTEQVLPALARDLRWPIRFDHCFKRICLDDAFGGCWYDHLQRPAERHLAGEPLARAIRCAELIVSGGLPALLLRDAASLRFRGKPPRRGASKASPARDASS